MKEQGLSRRIFLTRTATAGAMASCATFSSSPALASSDRGSLDRLRKEAERIKDRREDVMTGTLSSNGWEMEKITDGLGNIHTRPVPGTPLEGIPVRLGTVEVVLVHLVRRFHYEVDQVARGEVTAWQPPGTGAGAPPDTASTSRRRAASALERRQKNTSV